MQDSASSFLQGKSRELRNSQYSAQSLLLWTNGENFPLEMEHNFLQFGQLLPNFLLTQDATL